MYVAVISLLLIGFTPAAYATNCEVLLSCGLCTSIHHTDREPLRCGWYNNDRCVVGNSTRPTDERLHANMSSWITGAANCVGTIGPCDHGDLQFSRKKCMSTPGCGWLRINDTAFCTAGRETGPHGYTNHSSWIFVSSNGSNFNGSAITQQQESCSDFWHSVLAWVIYLVVTVVAICICLCIINYISSPLCNGRTTVYTDDELEALRQRSMHSEEADCQLSYVSQEPLIELVSGRQFGATEYITTETIHTGSTTYVYDRVSYSQSERKFKSEECTSTFNNYRHERRFNKGLWQSGALMASATLLFFGNIVVLVFTFASFVLCDGDVESGGRILIAIVQVLVVLLYVLALFNAARQVDFPTVTGRVLIGAHFILHICCAGLLIYAAQASDLSTSRAATAVAFTVNVWKLIISFFSCCRRGV